MRLPAIAIAIASLSVTTLHAQDMPFPETVVVTGTRLPTPAENIAAGITTIDRQTIEQRGYTTLADALSAVPGLRLVQSGGPGSVASVFIRGTNSNQVLVLRDGIPINDPGDPGGLFNFGSDTLQDIERIEIVRGPMSSLYGSGAIGGVINLITRRGAGALHGDATIAAGLPRSALVRLHAAGRTGVWDYSASAEAQSFRGFDQTPQRETPIFTNEADGDRSRTGEIEIGVTPAAGTRISLLLRGRDATYGFDDQNFVTFDHGNATGRDAALFGRLGITSTLFDGALDTSLFLTGLRNDRQYVVTLVPGDPNQDSSDNRYHGRRADLQWNNVVHLPDQGPARNTSLTLSYEHAADQARTTIRSASFGSSFDSQVAAHADTDSGSVALQTTLFERLIPTIQAREDLTTLAGDAFTWRAGAVLKLPEIASSLKASYGTGFRAPALFDRYGIDNSGYVGNPALRPEHAQGWEAGIATEIPIPGGGVAISFAASYFDNRIRDLINFAFSPVDTTVNIGAARTHGVETTLGLRVAAWLSADLGYTYTVARNLTAQAPLLRRPLNQGSLDLVATPFPGLTVAPEFLYVGSFADFLVNHQGAPSGVGRSPGGLIFNLNLTWQAAPGLQIFVWGKNLGDSTYEPASGYQTPGTSFLAGAKLGF